MLIVSPHNNIDYFILSTYFVKLVFGTVGLLEFIPVNSSIVKVKNQVDMPILRNSVCQRIRKDFFSHTEICTGYKNGGKDFCSVCYKMMYSII